MKSMLFFFLPYLIIINTASGQFTKVAILDFENTSGKIEFETFGKALSSMLITDLRNNIHPKKIEFFERNQLNKILEEQKLQKSKNFDSKTAVNFGKLSGVNYIVVGSIFVFDGQCNITSRLLDVKTSKVLVAREVNGKIENLLQLKSKLAEELAIQLNNPISLSDAYNTGTISMATLNQYGKIINSMDSGDFEKAEQMRSLFEETNPDFKYFTDIKDDIDKLKKQVAKNTADIAILNKSGGRVVNANTLQELTQNLYNQLTTFDEACSYIKGILNYSPSETEAILGNFSNLPAPSILKTMTMKNPIEIIEIERKDHDFFLNCLKENNLNASSCSHYIFYRLRRFYIWAKQRPEYLDLKEDAIKLAEALENYNLRNKISNYNIQYLGGEWNFIFNYKKENMNLSTKDLILMLNSLR